MQKSNNQYNQNYLLNSLIGSGVETIDDIDEMGDHVETADADDHRPIHGRFTQIRQRRQSVKQTQIFDDRSGLILLGISSRRFSSVAARGVTRR